MQSRYHTSLCLVSMHSKMFLYVPIFSYMLLTTLLPFWHPLFFSKVFLLQCLAYFLSSFSERISPIRRGVRPRQKNHNQYFLVELLEKTNTVLTNNLTTVRESMDTKGRIQKFHLQFAKKPFQLQIEMKALKMRGNRIRIR